jgi:hypothetical protein
MSSFNRLSTTKEERSSNRRRNESGKELTFGRQKPYQRAGLFASFYLFEELQKGEKRREKRFSV